ncbi:MAG: superoxide dismutase family protein [Xanthobacteraceae bacterium]
MKALIFGAVSAAVLATSAVAQEPLKATATFINSQGDETGTATLTETPNGLLISLDLRGLPTGEHGFHIHEKGVCNAADGFASAGGHFNPTGKKHGYMVLGGVHAGDMPNQVVALDGRLRGNIINPNVTLTDRAGTLFGNDGTAFVLHDRPDDYTSQPSGSAGDRIACGVIKKVNAPPAPKQE